MLFGVIPQVVPEFLAVTIFWWDHNVRMSTVLGLVGGGGIGYLLIQYIQLLQYNQAATVLWLIVAVVTAMDYASAAMRQRDRLARRASAAPRSSSRLAGRSVRLQVVVAVQLVDRPARRLRAAAPARSA